MQENTSESFLIPGQVLEFLDIVEGKISYANASFGMTARRMPDKFL